MKKASILITVLALGFHVCAQQTDTIKVQSNISFPGWSKPDNKEPLIIIDGNKQYIRGTTALKDINPENIESINILKDSAAIRKYQFDGTAGAIEVKTRNGDAGFYQMAIDTGHIILKSEMQPGFRSANPSKVIIRNLLQKDLDPKAEPMYVLDGKEVQDIKKLDPSTIASVDVIKNAAGKSSYGDKGKNGVIIITTIKAKKKSEKKN
ncbi:TonB-dependent receptor plug domain-containing protein [Pedobacter sp. GR22-10]|uniref:TonB-dependent receptor plug domain-containing protein n=1 Tax=Pedobacter sp. GR22-10 TaxID=2994472 RepID=UPI002247E04E|nr:TonB-dependent receptor plug domain-containing protein [Pedobacter sp. GR22-10]MCX2433123.1 TonB-dependent receptor plug domain-containing protein [Pedobacter sp. GR22-10]